MHQTSEGREKEKERDCKQTNLGEPFLSYLTSYWCFFFLYIQVIAIWMLFGLNGQALHFCYSINIPKRRRRINEGGWVHFIVYNRSSVIDSLYVYSSAKALNWGSLTLTLKKDEGWRWTVGITFKYIKVVWSLVSNNTEHLKTHKARVPVSHVNCLGYVSVR